jgi:hypothetical protein
VRNTILTALAEELRDKIQPSSDYSTTIAEVRRGIALGDEFIMKPALSVWCYHDTTDGQFAGRDDRTLHIYIYGYVDADGVNVDNIHNVLDDVLYFLQNDFTYKDDVYVGDAVVYEGGVSDPNGIFELEIQIKYERNISQH